MVLQLIVGIVLGVGIVGSIIVAGLRNRKPVRFGNLDEQFKIYNVARWVAKELNLESRDRRLLYSLNLYNYSFLPMGSIPVEELAILAPWIDRVIDGKGPPQKYPAGLSGHTPSNVGTVQEAHGGRGTVAEIVTATR